MKPPSPASDPRAAAGFPHRFLLMAALVLSLVAYPLFKAYSSPQGHPPPPPPERKWIPCTPLKNPYYEVTWRPQTPPAELPVGTEVTASAEFKSGEYRPGYWDDEPAPPPAEWPWKSASSFPETVRISHDQTKVYIRIKGSYALDPCDPGFGDWNVAETPTGTFDAKGTGGDSDPDGGPLQDAAHAYDPGDGREPDLIPSYPPGFPWQAAATFPKDDSQAGGEIHGEVRIDGEAGTYELLNYTQHKKRGNIPTLCKAQAFVVPVPADGSPAEKQEINLSLTVLSIDSTEDPILAALTVQPGDITIANEDYEFWSEHKNEIKPIQNWPFTAPEDSWKNRSSGTGVYRISPPGASKLKFRPKNHQPPRPSRPLTLFLKYQPKQGSDPDISSRAMLTTQLDLSPVEVVELAPKMINEEGNPIDGSEKPSTGRPLTPFVEVLPHLDKIAHRELKIRIGERFSGKKVIWSLKPLPGATPPTIRGYKPEPDETKSQTRHHSLTHPDRFEKSGTWDTYAWRKISQIASETIVAPDGHTAIRVNVPPIGFNQVRIKINVEGMTSPIDLIDMEVPGVVVIDPGHGGHDSGTVARTDATVFEKDLTLAYGLKLRDKLKKRFIDEKRGFRITMTRNTTEGFLSPDARAQAARIEGADILVSLHFNDGPPSARGSETFVEREPGNQNLMEDAALAGALQQSTVAAVRTQDEAGMNRVTFKEVWVLDGKSPIPGVKTAGFAVTRDGENYNGNSNGYNPVKACLIEVEFISNEKALSSVSLVNPSGKSIMDIFGQNGAIDIFTNIINQP